MSSGTGRTSPLDAFNRYLDSLPKEKAVQACAFICSLNAEQRALVQSLLDSKEPMMPERQPNSTLHLIAVPQSLYAETARTISQAHAQLFSDGTDLIDEAHYPLNIQHEVHVRPAEEVNGPINPYRLVNAPATNTGPLETFIANFPSHRQETIRSYINALPEKARKNLGNSLSQASGDIQKLLALHLELHDAASEFIIPDSFTL